MRLAIISAAASLVASPAFGQAAYSVPTEQGRVQALTPASIPTGGRLSDAERGRITAVDFATCTVARHPVGLRNLLEKPFSPESMTAIAKMTSSECLAGGELRMRNISARAALYQALYRADFRPGQPALPPTPVHLADPAGLEGDAAAVAFMVRFGDCVVRADLPHSRAAVLTAVASPAEAEAYAALAPSFGPCMPAGSVVHMNKALVSGGLSEALYREAIASQLASSGKAH